MKNKKLLFSLLFLLIFIIGIIFKSKLIWIDDFFYSIIIFFKSDFTTNLMKVFSFFCNPIWCLILIILVLIVSKNKYLKKYFIINLILVVGLNFLLKLIFNRNRPIDINLIVESGYSFPSGHAMVSLAMYGYLIYFCLKNKKYLFSLLLGLLILLIGISRIYLGVHYASDVIGGFIISLSYLLFYLNCISKYFKEV